jgi:hypothetical protein
MRVLPGRNAAPYMDEQGAASVAQDETQDQIKDNHQSTRPGLLRKIDTSCFYFQGMQVKPDNPDLDTGEQSLRIIT